MHATSYASMERFYREYCEPLAHRLQRPLRILEVGSRDVNGSYRPIFAGHEYMGIDVTEGPGVDRVVFPHEWADKSLSSFDPIEMDFDVVICGQTLEHDSRWWLTLEQIFFAVSDGGLACIIAPGAGPKHNEPDYYRFLPDAPKIWAELLNAELLESWWNTDSIWRDCGGIFKFKG